MKRFLNYIGQLRLYSLVDLILLLVVLRANTVEFIGVILLHVAFLTYLENTHSHKYRSKIPYWISYVLMALGLAVYGKIEGFIYLFFSFLYAQKVKKLGFVSPLFRGFQNFFIVAGVIGYQTPLPYIIGGLFFIRNLVGDFRDVEKDKKEGMKTVPVLLGVKRNIKYIHLIFIIFTSVVWWYLSLLSIGWLLLIIIIEILTYNLTPRSAAS